MNINKEIEVLDKIMGSGKTTTVMDWMKSSPEQLYMFVAPSLDEAENRIPSYCEELYFQSPSVELHDNKSQHLLDLLKSGTNISTTHHLFSNMRDEHLRVIKDKGYIVVVDENVDLVESYDGRVTKKDLELLLRSESLYVDSDNLGQLVWLDEDDDSFKYNRLRTKCRANQVFSAKRSNTMLVSLLPLSLIDCAKRFIVITYLFEGSVMNVYLKSKGYKFKPFAEVKLRYTDEQIKVAARRLINISTTKSVDAVMGYRQTYSWYTMSNRGSKEELKDIASAIRSVYRLYPDAVNRVLVTCPKSLIEAPSKAKGGRSVKHSKVPLQSIWLDSGCKGSNTYKDRDVVVYCYSKYPNSAVNYWMVDWEIGRLDYDKFALSEMVQFIWRSCIRDMELDENGNLIGGKPLHLYITNSRMLEIFEKWLYS